MDKQGRNTKEHEYVHLEEHKRLHNELADKYNRYDVVKFDLIDTSEERRDEINKRIDAAAYD